MEHDDDYVGGAVGFWIFLLFAWAFVLAVTAVQWVGRLWPSGRRRQ